MKPPLIKGGQNRTAQDILNSANAIFALIVILLVLIATLAVGQCHE